MDLFISALAKGIKNPKCEFGLKINYLGLNAKFYQKLIHYSASESRRARRKRKRKKVTLPTKNPANIDSQSTNPYENPVNTSACDTDSGREKQMAFVYIPISL